MTGMVVAGSCALLWLFTTDMNRVSTRIGQSPLGTVVFKKLTATRRPSDGLGWERMQNNSPVYDADTLRTADFSEAAVYFDDGTSLDLGENSMLKLNFGGATRSLEFLEGEITVGGSSAESNYSISGAAGTITVGKDSKATFSRKEGTVSVDVSKGNATFVKADGSTQNIAENQELAVDLQSGVASFVSRPILPLIPERNARLLSYATDVSAPANLDFSWQLENGDAASNTAASAAAVKFTLEFSASKNFDDEVTGFAVTGVSANVPVKSGTWYWRLTDATGEKSQVRKFTISTAAQTQVAFPSDGVEYSYRKTKPVIRFAWTGMEEASAYLFEISTDSSFAKPRTRTRVAATNLSVNDLDAGLWYWRVKPVHGFKEINAAPTTQFRTVKITKSGAMGKPEVSTPFDSMLYQVQELEGKGLAFAWIPEAEAVSYELALSKTKDMSSPALRIPSAMPYTKLGGDQAKVLEKPGVWYWTVRWLDREGNLSPDSAIRSFTGVDGSIAIRPVFPPDGYRVADSLVTNGRFTWKSNIAAKTIFLVARDSGFTDIAYQETVQTETLLGKKWAPGMYYWKLRTINVDGSVFIETPSRYFTIVEPLPSPTVVSPVAGKQFYLREHDSVTIKWDEVQGADYYSLAILSPSDNYVKPIFEKNFLTDTKIDFALGDESAGIYRVRLQGFAMESDISTKIIGYSGESSLVYKKLTYLTLLSPKNGSTIEGLVAQRKGVSLKYKTDNVPDEQKFLLYGNKAGNKEIAHSAGSGNAWLKKKLAPGRYYWTVKGTLAGFDISAFEKYYFEVLPITPLPKAELVSPASDITFGADWFRANRSITFEWKQVEGATSYVFKLYPKGSETPILSEDALKATEFTLQDLSVLAKSTFIWMVEAQSYDADGELEQPGQIAEGRFTIDLPAVKKAATKGGEQLYGR